MVYSLLFGSQQNFCEPANVAKDLDGLVLADHAAVGF
jgi:hypothetical protein